jgi:hypothetical protein
MPGGKDDILPSSYARANDSHSTPSRYRKAFGRPNNVGIELVIKFDTWFYWALGQNAFQKTENISLKRHNSFWPE